MKNILIPVDFSKQSWNTALCALELYKNKGVCFYVFFSEKHDDIPSDTTVLYESPIAELASWVKRLKKIITQGQVIISLKSKGKFIIGLREAVSSNQIDLIVMNTHYPNILSKNIDRNHVRDVITRVKCPLLVVPRELSCISPEQVVLLTDFNFKHQSQPTSIINQFIKKAGAHLNVLHLSKTGNALSETRQTNKSFLQSAFDTIPHSFHFVMEKTIDKALQLFVDVQKVNLVILFAKNINLSEKILFTSSLDEEKDYQKNIPFLVVHE